MQRIVAIVSLILLSIISSAAVAEAQVSVDFDPGGGTYTTNEVTVDVYFCSETAPLTNERFITLNDVDVTNAYFSYVGTGGACNGWGEHWSGTIELQLGSNTLYAYAYSEDDQWGSNTGTFVYSLPVATVTVTNNGAGTLGVGQTTTMTARAFAANGTELFGHTFYWSGTRMHASAQANPQRTSVTATADVAGQGSMTAMTSNVSGTAYVTVVNPTYAVAVSSNRPSNITLSSGATSTGTTTYTVSNNSSYTNSSSTFTMTATPTGVIGTCSVSPSSYTLVPAGGNVNVSVTCPIGTTTASSSPTVTFKAEATSPSTFSQTHVTTFNVSPNYAFTVSMPNGSTKTEPSQQTSGSAVFRIHNNSTNTGSATTVSYSASCTPVLSCSASTNVSVPQGSYANVTVPYSITWIGVNGSVQLTATTPSGNPSATIAVNTTPHYGGVSVLGPPTTTIAPGQTTGSTTFTVQNLNKNVGPVTYTLTRSCSSPLLSACGGTPATVNLNDQASSGAVTVTYNVSKSETTGSVILTATSTSPSASRADTTLVSATPVYALPNVAIAYPDRYRDASRCPADCFEVTAAYTSPAYRSLDVDRSATLLYRSGRARPLGTIVLDATDPSSSPVVNYSLLLRRPDNSLVTFTNNSTEIFFVGGSGTTRLVAQFDASAFTTGSHRFTAVVRSRWPDATLERTDSVRVMILNSTASTLGAGWELAQLQRAWVQSDGTVLVASGDGSASHFTSCAGTPCTMGAPRGDPTTLTKTATGYERTYLDGTKLRFNAAGLLQSVADRLGNKDSVVYDGVGKVTALRDPLGYALTIAYDGSGKLSGITAPASSGPGRTASFLVNAAGDLQRGTDPDGIVNFTGTYDAQHRLGTLRDRRGSDWITTYGPDGGILNSDAPSILVNGAMASPRITFSAPNRPLFQGIAWNQGTSANPVTRITDLRGWIRGARSDTTKLTTNRFGFVTRMDLPDGTYATATIDTLTGLATRTASPTGHVERMTWSNYLLTKIVDSTRADSVVVSYTTYARPQTITGPVVQTFTYNDASRQFTVQYGNQPAATHAYDTYGRTTTVTDPGGHVTTSSYAATGLRNLDWSEIPGSPTPRRTTYRYDVYGRNHATVYPDGRRDSTVFDLVDRLTKTVDAKNGAVTFAYDSLYLRSITDQRGKVTKYFTNAVGWVEKELRAGSLDTLFTRYDSAGNVIGTTNREGRVVSYRYDAMGRLDRRSAGTDTAFFAYQTPTTTQRGFVAARNALSADTTWFNTKGQVDTIVARMNGNWYKLSHQYFTTPGKRLAAIWATSNKWSNNKFQQFGYNAPRGTLDTLTVVSELTSVTTTLHRTGNSESFADSITYSPTLKQYETVGALHRSYSRTFNVSGVNTKLGVKASLDLGGRIASLVNVTQDTLRTFKYDSLGRVTRYDGWELVTPTCTPHTALGVGCTAADSFPVFIQAFTYDAAGNRLTGVSGAIDDGNRVYIVNNDTLTYDKDGNLKTKRRRPALDQVFHWNALGLLDSVISNGVTVAYGYDAMGRRIRRIRGADVTWFLWNGDNVLMELDWGGAPKREYSYWGVDNPHSMRIGPETYYFAQDPAGQSVSGLIRRSDNAVVAEYHYDAYGALQAGSTEAVANPLRFAGAYYDTTTALYYNRARYYDAGVGRFISEDPIGADGGLNLYAYAGGDPVNFRDPDGMSALPTECYGHLEVVSHEGEVLSATWYRDICIGSAGGPTEPPWPEQPAPTEPPHGPGSSRNTRNSSGFNDFINAPCTQAGARAAFDLLSGLAFASGGAATLGARVAAQAVKSDLRLAIAQYLRSGGQKALRRSLRVAGAYDRAAARYQGAAAAWGAAYGADVIEGIPLGFDSLWSLIPFYDFVTESLPKAIKACG